ncbi:MAG: TIGR02452 family protein [Chromatiaceae bacterium]|nr:TIGR02452 family protein [Chromatiaceae bacterium]
MSQGSKTDATSSRTADPGGNKPTGLLTLPCPDSADHAQRCRARLSLPRTRARALGESALEAIEQGHYPGPSGERIDWRTQVETAVAAKQSLPPEADLPAAAPAGFAATEVQVANETTLMAARRRVEQGDRVLALNFANGLHPGGGFLSGARAQEEVLCRSSALFATLRGDAMYAHHAQRPQPDSTHWAILSPEVPVFRTDEGTALDEPWHLSVVTCAAPYVPGVGQPLAGDLLQARIERVLAIAQAFGYETLVLGAWGCGAFENDPRRTAEDFQAALAGRFAGAFGHVVFAIADWSSEREFLGPFRDVFSESVSTAASGHPA